MAASFVLVTLAIDGSTSSAVGKGSIPRRSRSAIGFLPSVTILDFVTEPIFDDIIRASLRIIGRALSRGYYFPAVIRIERSGAEPARQRRLEIIEVPARHRRTRQSITIAPPSARSDTYEGNLRARGRKEDCEIGLMERYRQQKTKNKEKKQTREKRKRVVFAPARCREMTRSAKFVL